MPHQNRRRTGLVSSRTLHRAPVGQGPSGPDWLATAFGFWSGRALATGTAWAGLCLIHHNQLVWFLNSPLNLVYNWLAYSAGDCDHTGATTTWHSQHAICDIRSARPVLCARSARSRARALSLPTPQALRPPSLLKASPPHLTHRTSSPLSPTPPPTPRVSLVSSADTALAQRARCPTAAARSIYVWHQRMTTSGRHAAAGQTCLDS